MVQHETSRLRAHWPILLLCGALLWSPVRSEVSVDLDVARETVNTIIFGEIIEDPDPIPLGAWQQYRALPEGQVLNADGDERGDGPPDLFIRGDGAPVVVWAYASLLDFDVAISEWDGVEWTMEDFVTMESEDEIDPRVFMETDETTHVVWWVPGVDDVMLKTRDPITEIWGDTIVVTDPTEAGRRPSVAVYNGLLYVVYERDSGADGMSQDVVVAAETPGVGFVKTVVASTTRTAPLVPMIHVSGENLWIDWINSASAFACTELGPSGWSSIETTPWVNPNWVGVEETRRLIQLQVNSN